MDSEKLDAATAAALGEAEEEDEIHASPGAAEPVVDAVAPAPADDSVLAAEPDAENEQVADHQQEKVAPADEPANGTATAAPAISAGPVVGVVRLFGMPIEVSDSEIRDFLQLDNLPESRILQICGLRGEALVGLDSDASIDAALARDHEHIGKRWVGVKREPDEAISRFFYDSPEADEFRAIALTGLPFSVSEADLAKFASGFNVDKVAPRPAVIVPDSKSAKRSSGEGMVLLNRAADAKAATAALHKKDLAGRWVTVRPAMQREFDAAVAVAGPPLAASAAADAAPGGGRGNSRGYTCIHAKGLPFAVGRTEFQHWLMDNRVGGIADRGEAVIVALARGGQRSRGDAYIRFVSPQAVDDATRISGAKLGGRYIEMIPCPLAEAQAEVNMPDTDGAAGGPDHGPPPPHAAERGPPPAAMPPPQAGNPFAMADRAVPEVPLDYPGIVAVRGLGNKARPEDVLDACQAAGRQAFLNDVFIIASVSSGGTGDAYIRFRNCSGEEAAATAAALCNIPVAGRPVQAVAAFQGDLNKALQRPPDFLGATPENAIRMRGTPWQASERDICEWFSCVEGVPCPARLHIIPDPRQGGRPSGDVLVLFLDAARAEAALCRNKAHMRGRYVELFRCSEEEFMKLSDPSMPPPDFAHLPGGKFYHPTRKDMGPPPRSRGRGPRGGGYEFGGRHGPPRDGGRYQRGPPPHAMGGPPPPMGGPGGPPPARGGDWAAEWGNGGAQPPPAWGAGAADQGPPPPAW